MAMLPKIDPDGPGFLFGDLARLNRAAFEREVSGGAVSVTPAEARVMAHMARCGAVRQNRLACSLGVSPMSLTEFLDRLEAAGLIERCPDPDDRRAKIVTLTAAANGVLTQITAAAERTRAAASKGVSNSEWAQFRAIALKVRENLRTARDSATATKKDAAP